MLKKLVSLTTALAFLGSFIVAPSVQGAVTYAEGTRYTAAARSAVNGPLPAFGLDISPANGRITETHDCRGGPLVINIQDLHCHPEVQRNIAAILGQIEHSFGAAGDKRSVQVFVEGGYGAVDTSWINAVTDTAARTRVMAALVDAGRLTGAELYAMQTNRPTMLTGLEDEKIHKANLVRLGTMLENKPRYERQLAQLKRELDGMQARYFGMQNQRLSRIIERYRAGDITPVQYYTLLGKYIAKINGAPRSYDNIFALSLDNYPNIQAHQALSAIVRDMNFRRVSAQMQAFMRGLKGVMSYAAYNDLLKKADGQRDLDRMYLALAAALAAEQAPQSWVPAARKELTRYGELRKFFSYILLKERLNPVQLLHEERALVEDLRTAFSRSSAEREVAFLVDFFECFDGYLLNRLSASDYGYFQSRFDKFTSVWGKYTFVNRIKELSGDFPLLDAYYAANQRRNAIFLQSLDALQAGSPRGVGVIVSGGFHTEGLTKLLAERKVSCLTITPNITCETRASGDIYQRLAREQARRFGTQALQLALGSYGAKVVSSNGNTIVLSMGDQTVTLTHDGNAITSVSGELFVPGLSKGPVAIADLNRALAEPLAALARVPRASLFSVAAIVMKLGPAVITSGSTRGWWGGNGLIWTIATDPAVQKMIEKDGYDINEIATLPAFLQEAISEQGQAMESLKAKAQGNPFLAALFQINSVSSLIAPLLTGHSESVRPGAIVPSTRKLGERWGWSEWAIRDILAPVVENFGMLLQPWKFGARHTQYVERQQRTLTGLAWTTAITAALAGAGTAIAVALFSGMLLAGAGAGVLAWFATGAITHAGWNIFSSLPATMGEARPNPGALMQINALATGATFDETKRKLIPGTAAQLKDRIPELIKAGYKEIYLVGLPRRGDVATRMALGDRKREEKGYKGYDKAGQTRIVVQTKWPGVESDLGKQYVDPERASQYITASPFASAHVTDVDPAWGTERDIIDISNMLRSEGGRLIVDVVPNHIGVDNTWIDGVTELDGETIPNWQATIHIDFNEIVENARKKLSEDLNEHKITEEEHQLQLDNLLRQQQAFEALSDNDLFDVREGSPLQHNCPDIYGGLMYVLNEHGMKEDVLAGVSRYAVYYTEPGKTSSRVLIAHGKDPFCPAWEDTLQMDFTHPLARKFVLSNIEYWAQRNVSVRMDMSHLLNRYWIMRTWFPGSADFSGQSDRFGSEARAKVEQQLASFYREHMPMEFWREAVDNIVRRYPEFTMLLESYQDEEFMRTLHPRVRVYEKISFLDNIRAGNIQGLRGYLGYLQWANPVNVAHFLQNHDEEGVWYKGVAFVKAATALMVTIPGVPFFHWPARFGLDRFKIQVLRPQQPAPMPGMQQFTDAMARIAADPLFRQGKMQLLDSLNRDVVVFLREFKGRRALVAINLTDKPQDVWDLPLPSKWIPKEGHYLQLKDAYYEYKPSVLAKRADDSALQPVYHRTRDEAQHLGLRLGAHDAHIFYVEEVSESLMLAETVSPSLMLGKYGDNDISAYEKELNTKIIDLDSWFDFLNSRNLLRELRNRPADEQVLIRRSMELYLPVWQQIREEAPGFFKELTPDQQAMLREGMGMVRFTDMESIRKAFLKLVNIYRLRAPPDGMMLGLLPRNFENDDDIVSFVESDTASSWVWPVAANEGTPYELNDHLAAYSPTFADLVSRLHGIGRRVMVDAVVNHLGLANTILDEQPELFESSPLSKGLENTMRPVFERLQRVARENPEIAEAARMTLNTLHFIATSLIENKKDFFNPDQVASSAEFRELIGRISPSHINEVSRLLTEKSFPGGGSMLSLFLSVDRSVAHPKRAWDVKKNRVGDDPVPQNFLRINRSNGTYAGHVFRHGSDAAVGQQSVWVNTVQLNWAQQTEDVKKFVVNMLIEWVKRYGVDGFRLDAAHWLTHDPQHLKILNAIRIEVQKEVQDRFPGKTLAFTVETYDDPAAIAKTGMLAYLGNFQGAIYDFVMQGHGGNLVNFLVEPPAGMGVYHTHDKSQEKSFVDFFQPGNTDETRQTAIRRAALVLFLQDVSGIPFMLHMADEAYVRPAQLMEFSATWQQEVYEYLRAFRERMGDLRARYAFMRNNTRYIFRLPTESVLAGAKWDDGQVVIWAAATNADYEQSKTHISAEQLRAFNANNNVPQKAKIDPHAMYQRIDLVTGAEYGAVSGSSLLEKDGLSLFLSKDDFRREGEWVVSPDEVRTPPFQVILLKKIEDTGAAMQARVKMLHRGIVKVDGLSGYVCARDADSIYVATALRNLTAFPDGILVEFHNRVCADIKDENVISRSGDMMIIAIPINELYNKTEDRSTERPIWYEERVAMANSIRVLSTAENPPGADESVRVISGAHEQRTNLPITFGSLQLPSSDPARPRFNPTDSGSPIFNTQGEVVGILTGEGADGSHTIVPAGMIVAQMHVHIPSGDVGKFPDAAAVLPQNEARFTHMANRAGMTARRLAGFAALVEFVPSMLAALRIGTFVADHGDRNTGAKKLVSRTRLGLVAGAAAGVVAGMALFGGALAVVATAAAGAILAGSAVNLITHMQIDFIVAKSLLDAVRQDGFASLEGGDVHAAVFIVNTPPAGIENLDAFIIGTTASGEKIWAMAAADGKIVFYSDAPSADVMSVIAERVRETAPAGISRASAFQEQVRHLLLRAVDARRGVALAARAKLKANINNAIMGMPVWRAMDKSGTGVAYDTASGAVQLSRDASAGTARAISAGDAVATRRGFLKYVGTASDRFAAEKSVSALLALTGEQVVVDGIARAQQLQQVARDRKISLDVYALISAAEATPEAIRSARNSGVAGCVVQRSGQSYQLVDFATVSGDAWQDTAVAADKIDIANREAKDIEKEVRASKAQCHILDISSIVGQLDTERDPLAKEALRDLLGPRILAFFNVHSYSERYLRDVVYGMPVDQLTAETRAAYLARMRADIKDDAVYNALQEAFNIAWKERLDSEAWIQPAFAATITQRHRQMIGRAVALLPEGAVRVRIAPDDIPPLNEENVADQFQKAQGGQPDAISAFITMIELFDMQFTGSIAEVIQPQDMQAFAAILSAA